MKTSRFSRSISSILLALALVACSDGGVDTSSLSAEELKAKVGGNIRGVGRGRAQPVAIEVVPTSVATVNELTTTSIALTNSEPTLTVSISSLTATTSDLTLLNGGTLIQTSTALSDAAVKSTTLNGTAVQTTPTAFSSRPFLWQSDLPRLIAMRDQGNPWAIGQTSNSSYPQAFLSVMIAQLGRATPDTLGAQNSVPKTWELALAGWILEAPGSGQQLTTGHNMRVQAKNEALQFLNSNPHPLGSSDKYQHANISVWAVGVTLDLCYDLLSPTERIQMAQWIQTSADWIEP